MKTIIYFMRHGEVYNPSGVVYGRLSGFRLSENGIKQVEKSSLFFERVKLDKIYSSPLLRARQSAQIIADHLHKKVQISRLLTEVKLVHEGVSLEKYHRKLQPYIYDSKYQKEGQESIDQITMRMMKFVKLITKKHKNKSVLAISHGDPIMILKTHILGRKFTWLYKKNNYLSTSQWLKLEASEGKYTII